MTTTSYTIAWVIYLLAASGMCVILWRFSHNWRIEPRYISRTFLLVALFTPYFSNAEQSKFAPAMLVTLFEFIFGSTHTAYMSLTPIVILFCIGTLISLLYARRKTR